MLAIILNQNDWGKKSITIGIDILQANARKLGVTSSEISDIVETYFSGTSYSVVRDGNDQIPVVARAGDAFRNNLEDLVNLPITTYSGLVSLERVSVWQPRLDLSQLRRENQERQITISGKCAT